MTIIYKNTFHKHSTMAHLIPEVETPFTKVVLPKVFSVMRESMGNAKHILDFLQVSSCMKPTWDRRLETRWGEAVFFYAIIMVTWTFNHVDRFVGLRTSRIKKERRKNDSVQNEFERFICGVFTTMCPAMWRDMAEGQVMSSEDMTQQMKYDGYTDSREEVDIFLSHFVQLYISWLERNTVCLSFDGGCTDADIMHNLIMERFEPILLSMGL